MSRIVACLVGTLALLFLMSLSAPVAAASRGDGVANALENAHAMTEFSARRHRKVRHRYRYYAWRAPIDPVYYRPLRGYEYPYHYYRRPYRWYGAPFAVAVRTRY